LHSDRRLLRIALAVVAAGALGTVGLIADASAAPSCDPDGCACPVPGEPEQAGSAFLAPANPDHYARLGKVDARSRAEQAGIDRRQFSLAAMHPRYLAILDTPRAYLDLPPDAIALPAFPANSSTQTRAELDHLLELQAARTPEQVRRSQQLAGVYYRLSVKPGEADWSAMRHNLFHMGEQLGPWFSPERLPVTADFMARVWADASYYLWAAKLRFNRVRPYSIEPRLQNLETPNFPAYPSGHSGNSYVAAFVYEQLLPEHTELFHRNAADMAFSREILGVHFASDSESGRVFARQLVDRLLADPDFRRDLEAARAEVRAAHAEAGCA
jgi:acid phosphatase (class A)